VSRRLALGVSILWVPLAFLFDGVTVLLLPTKLAEAPDVASSIGLISFAGLAAAVMIQPLAGIVGDRYRARLERRRPILLVAVPTLIAVWMLSSAHTVLAAAAAYLAVQVGASILQSGQQTLIPEHVSGDHQGSSGGWKSALDLGGAFLAFLVLGPLLASGGTTAAAAAISVVLVASLGILWFTLPPTRERARPPMGVRWVGLPPGFVRLVAARFLFLLGTYGIGRFLLLLVADRLGIDPARAADETGTLLALFTLVGAVTALGSGVLVDRLGPLIVMRLGVMSSALSIAALIPMTGAVGVVVAGTVMALGTAAFTSANWAATTRLVPAPHAGRLMGLANLGTGGAAACAGLVGPLIDWGGFTPAILVALLATVATFAPLATTHLSPLTEPDTAGVTG
jgi:FSR family fosmidomycin resistance protein-like MFS transporter